MIKLLAIFFFAFPIIVRSAEQVSYNSDSVKFVNGIYIYDFYTETSGNGSAESSPLKFYVPVNVDGAGQILSGVGNELADDQKAAVFFHSRVTDNSGNILAITDVNIANNMPSFSDSDGDGGTTQNSDNGTAVGNIRFNVVLENDGSGSSKNLFLGISANDGDNYEVLYKFPTLYADPTSSSVVSTLDVPLSTFCSANISNGFDSNYIDCQSSLINDTGSIEGVNLYLWLDETSVNINDTVTADTKGFYLEINLSSDVHESNSINLSELKRGDSQAFATYSANTIDNFFRG